MCQEHSPSTGSATGTRTDGSTLTASALMPR